MEVVGWGSPVGLTIFLVGLGATLLLIGLAVRVMGNIVGVNNDRKR